MVRVSRSWIAVVVAMVMLCSAPMASAQFRRGGREYAKNADPVKTAFRDVVKGARSSTVTILGDGKEVALGAIVEADGWIISKASELVGKLTVRLPDGSEVEARTAGVADEHDLALLKVAAKGLKPVKWGDAPGMQVGQLVATVGEDENPVAVGVLSLGRREIPQRSGMLGVRLDDLADKNAADPEKKGVGALVAEVLSGSGAERAGVKDKDVIISFDGQEVTSRVMLVDMISRKRYGETVPLVVMRGEQKIELKATLSHRAQFRPDRSDEMNAMGGPLSQRAAGFAAVIQHDTVLKPSDCGGPLVNLSGEVIAINIARGGRTESYAVPADVVQKAVEKLMEKAVELKTVQKEKSGD